MDKIKKSKDQGLTQELNKTRQVLWRFSKVEKDVDKKRTTFSELFFDLAVVFVFALLASKLMGSVGHAVAQTEALALGKLGLPAEIIWTQNRWVGFLYWVVNFMALWFTWYQFSNYTKYHWIDNVGNNCLTLVLILTLVLQGSGIYFKDTALSNYSLLTSFVAARLIFFLAQFVAIKHSPKVEVSEELMIKTMRQLSITVVTVVLFIAYIVCTETGVLADTHVLAKSAIAGNTNSISVSDPWKSELFITVVLMLHFISRFTWKVFGSKSISDRSYKIVFHTKERHHLFIIIALGELLVVTLTSSFINNQPPTINYETIIYMFATPFIAIAIWYVYKTVFYKATPTQSKKNYYLYLICHVFLVLGILVFLGSLKSHMQADAYSKTKAFAPLLNEVQYISRTFYSLGVVIGISMIIISMAVYAKFATFRQRRWGQVVKGLAPELIAQATLVFIWFVVESVLFWLHIEVPFSTVMYVTIGVEASFAIWLVWRSQKIIKSLFDTVQEFDKYSAKLDQ